jgi:3(or 17)beta-hydroxysteroid dehydrogenase
VTRLAAKTALVTGAAGGIGAAIAHRFAEAGAAVMLADLNGDAAEATAARLRADGLAVTATALDVRSEDDWQAVTDALLARHGALDVLVNNAGIALPPAPSFAQSSYDDWKRIMAVNLDGVFLGMRAAVRAMGAKGGAIVNIGSVAGYVGTPGGAAYGGSKGGVRAITKQAAVALAREGTRVRVNAIHPCYVWTPLVEKSAVARFGDQAEAKIRALHPFGLIAAPDDVAYAALYLASDEARMVNGADLVVDGGLLAT